MDGIEYLHSYYEKICLYNVVGGIAEHILIFFMCSDKCQNKKKFGPT